MLIFASVSIRELTADLKLQQEVRSRDGVESVAESMCRCSNNVSAHVAFMLSHRPKPDPEASQDSSTLAPRPPFKRPPPRKPIRKREPEALSTRVAISLSQELDQERQAPRACLMMAPPRPPFRMPPTVAADLILPRIVSLE